MLDNIFLSIIPQTGIDAASFLICLAVSLVMGAMIALTFMFRSRHSASLVITLAMLPAVVQVIIMLVNGNLGTGIAVAGAFSLIRFRSAPGTAKEITGIFISVATGLACGTGYIGIAILFAVVTCALYLFYTLIRFGETKTSPMTLRITVPESLDHNGLFDDLLKEYTSYHELHSVKTTNMGSMFRLTYDIVLKDPACEKPFMDAIRCRNGNLEVSISKTEHTISGEL